MLTTKEFKERIEELAAETETKETVDEKRIIIKQLGEVVGYVYENKRYAITIFDRKELFLELFHVMTEYAQTPIDKREKKGKVFIEGINQLSCEKPDCLLWDRLNDEFYLDKYSEGDCSSDEQIIFTESEKEELERKTGVPLIWVDDE